jgi:hypothetical protein
MSTSLKSSRTTIFQLPEQGAEKNGFRRSPRIDDLASTLTWTTPQNNLFTRRSSHHDA